MKKLKIALLNLTMAFSMPFTHAQQQEPAPQKSDIKPPDAKPQKMADGTIKLGLISLDRKKKELSFPGFLNSPKLGTLEVLLVNPSPRGRQHEGLVITKTSPFQLEVMLYLLGAQSDIKRDVKGKKGSLIDIDIEWRDNNGEFHRDPVESWVLDNRTGKMMKRQGFYFVGSAFHEGVYQAEGNGNLCLLYSSTDATVLDCADKDSGNDIIFETNPERVNPGAYREVRVILSTRKER
ncbi:MAG: YdjY domain-containing protein [Lentisphaerales bacterium]|nr:YdjY domain-containing protein [Lentisphaerales bacterium]